MLVKETYRLPGRLESVEARERGLIPSLRQELDRLIEAGMWIHEVFYPRILQEFGD